MFLDFPGVKSTPISFKVDQLELDSVGFVIDYFKEIFVKHPAIGRVKVSHIEKKLLWNLKVSHIEEFVRLNQYNQVIFRLSVHEVESVQPGNISISCLVMLSVMSCRLVLCVTVCKL